MVSPSRKYLVVALKPLIHLNIHKQVRITHVERDDVEICSLRGIRPSIEDSLMVLTADIERHQVFGVVGVQSAGDR